jgi:hypothetical protein
LELAKNVAANSGGWNGGVSGVSVRLAEGRWTTEMVVLGKVSDEERRLGCMFVWRTGCFTSAAGRS